MAPIKCIWASGGLYARNRAHQTQQGLRGSGYTLTAAAALPLLSLLTRCEVRTATCTGSTVVPALPRFGVGFEGLGSPELSTTTAPRPTAARRLPAAATRASWLSMMMAREFTWSPARCPWNLDTPPPAAAAHRTCFSRGF
jgi:hypothetical protein